MWLRQWQGRYRERLKRWAFEPTGRYDKPTQQAILEVQRLAGQRPTGMLDADAWAAVEVVEKPKPPPAPDPPPAQTGGHAVRKARRKGKSTFMTYWRRYSNRGVVYGNTEGAPNWYPGKPFGPNEQGWHVKRLQELLGLKPTGWYNLNVQRKVRGLQRLHGLPVSGVCDVRVAALVDPDNVSEEVDGPPGGPPHAIGA